MGGQLLYRTMDRDGRAAPLPDHAPVHTKGSDDDGDDDDAPVDTKGSDDDGDDDDAPVDTKGSDDDDDGGGGGGGGDDDDDGDDDDAPVDTKGSDNNDDLVNPSPPTPPPPPPFPCVSRFQAAVMAGRFWALCALLEFPLSGCFSQHLGGCLFVGWLLNVPATG